MRNTSMYTKGLKDSKTFIAIQSRRFAAISVFLISFMILGCPGFIIPDQPQPAQPLITARPAPPGEPLVARNLFAGSLFPHPTGPTKLELDAPLTTERDGSETPYFAFEVNIRTEIAQGVELTWRQNNSQINMEEYVGPSCGDQNMAAMNMAATASHQTGIDFDPGNPNPASFEPYTDDRMTLGRPVWWVGCHINGRDINTHRLVFEPGPDITSSPSFIYHNVVVLLPAWLAAPPSSSPSTSNGLEVRATNYWNSLKSDVTFLPIERSPIMIGVVGDSIAWGQGVQENKKFRKILIDELTSQGRSDLRVIMKARSGAVLMSTTPPTTIAQAGCSTNLPDPQTSTGRNFGEVPDSNPTIPCQIKDLSSRTCMVHLPEETSSLVPFSPPPLVYSVVCNPPPPGTIESPPREVVFPSEGARFDFIFMDGCINDLGAVDIVRSPKYLIGPHLNPFAPPPQSANLTNAIRDKCTVSNAISDIGTILPNATIAYFGYHHFLSSESSLVNNCFGPVAYITPMAALMFGEEVRNEAGRRVDQFVRESNTVLGNSIGSLNSFSAKGAIIFVPTSPPFSPSTAAYALHSQTWGMECVPSIRGVDDVRDARAHACNLAGFAPNSIDHLLCNVVSAFHPDTNGHQVIANEISNALKALSLQRNPAQPLPLKFWVAPGQ